MRARDVERMEAELAELRKRVGPEPRPMAGYLTVVGDVEEMLRESRREQNELYEAKWAKFYAEMEAEPAASSDEDDDAASRP